MQTTAATERNYSYRALDADGQPCQGVVVAGDEAAALRDLVRQGLMPISVKAPGAPAAPTARVGGAGRVGGADRVSLVQELATLLGAGISLAEALPSLAQAYTAHALGPALAGLDRDVRAGQRFSEALARSPLGLPAYVVALAEAGEAGGELAGALRDAAVQMEHERRIGQELRNALVYPVVLVISGVLAVLVIFVGVVPRFASLLKSSRADVPALSRAVIEAGLFVKQNLLAFGLGSTALVLITVVALSRPAVRAAAFDALSRMPVVGPWLLRLEIGRWTTVLGQLLANRVPIITALVLSSGALRLRRLRDDLAAAPRELERGRTLSDVLGGLDWFPATRLNLVRVGERSGELPRMLAVLGAMETDAARTLQKRALALIEPAAILLIGGVIGFIMVAVMMAITSLNTVAL
jgi:general secretion pathway protein F